MFSLVKSSLGRPYVRRIRLGLACVSITANALCAGGVFCFPILSPALVSHLKLTQPQLTTIALAGMAGQYPAAALVGKAIDYFGPWACSLAAAGFFSTGYGLFAHEIAKIPDDTLSYGTSSYRRLALYFFICALGTVSSYFSSIFAASKNFPHYIGMATGISTALFGLSPTFLTILATRYFSHPDTGLDVTHFLRFLAYMCGIVHIFGALTMHVLPPAEHCTPTLLEADPEARPEPNERTSLLPNKTNSTTTVDMVATEDQQLRSHSTIDLFKDVNFWVLAFILFVVFGSCEMIISNIGTVVLSLHTERSRMSTIPSDVVTSTQVRTISLANTISRLLIGPLADFVSPVFTHLPSRGTHRKHLVSRIVFLTFSSSVLVCTYLWMVVGVRSQGAISALSIGAGIAYGSGFTVLPSLVSAVWGIHNLGRNYGILTYAPLLGTPTFSYLYAFIAAGHAPADGGVCTGVHCWRTTFEISGVAAVLALAATLWLWRAWRGKV